MNQSQNSSLDLPIKTIFILEDEPDIAELIAINLKKSGFKTKEFTNADLFYKQLKKEKPDLLILDLMLPDTDGLEVCKSLRSNSSYSSIPIIMLTAKADEIDKIIGLELGADDYVTKPFSPRELVARVKAVLRREIDLNNQDRVRVADILEIDFAKFEVYVEGKKAELTNTELKLLKLLLHKKGWVYSRGQILDYLDPDDKGVLDRTVDVHIKNLREKLGPAGKLIKNIRGVGYKFEV
ncbi:MAG: response regulator [Candidatus Kapabacteria bacterium]|nr:response regulator [Candidatus Kapabacteria bacterium]